MFTIYKLIETEPIHLIVYGYRMIRSAFYWDTDMFVGVKAPENLANSVFFTWA